MFFFTLPLDQQKKVVCFQYLDLPDPKPPDLNLFFCFSILEKNVFIWLGLGLWEKSMIKKNSWKPSYLRLFFRSYNFFFYKSDVRLAQTQIFLIFGKNESQYALSCSYLFFKGLLFVFIKTCVIFKLAIHLRLSCYWMHVFLNLDKYLRLVFVKKYSYKKECKNNT